MLSTGLFAWLSNDQQLLATLGNNWLLGVALVAAIVFLETGLVVLPFLPGDSLLFTTGAFLGLSGISPIWAIVLITFAAIAGDGLNFMVGRSRVGQAILESRWVKPKQIQLTRRYFDRFGASAVTIARFVPIVRTITPFLAGMSGMNSSRFAAFNVLGAMAWCPSLVLAGYWLGGVGWIRAHMGWLTLTIVIVSLVPLAFQAWRARMDARTNTEQDQAFRDASLADRG